MKGIRRKVLKWFVIFTYPILLVALIALGILFYLKNSEYNRLQDTYAQAQTQLNRDNQDKEVTIADLQKDFEDLVKTVNDLRTENRQLKDELSGQQAEGLGIISGKIFPLITAGNGNFNQYQRVCAEGKQNGNLQFCATVSALTQDYKIYLPAGEYFVYSETFPQSNDLRGYYTIGVNCAQGLYGETGCDEADQTPLTVTVTAGKETKNVDPVDWTGSEAE